MSNKNRGIVTIITIGDELLIGQTIDTNSAWMGTALNSAGLQIKRRVAVGDSWNDIWEALNTESADANIILITGGLGPTADDITKPLLCQYFGGELVIDQKAHENVVDIFTKKLSRPLLERNLKQAEVPNNCMVIQNKRGTAPGMVFEKDGKIFVSMPGVPHEMKGMMTDEVIPMLINKFGSGKVIHKTLLTAGIGESFLAETLTAFENTLPEQIKLAYLPSYGMVRLRLTTVHAEMEIEIEERFGQLKKIVASYLVTDIDQTLQETVAASLLANNKTLAIAESCTGGYIAHLITALPGSSQYFLGGVVSYSNELKSSLLGVPTDTIQTFGAVSIQTAEKMAEGLRMKTGADFCLATSGIMGPTGGSDIKPVGFVCVGLSTSEKTISTTLQFRFDRIRNIELTAIHALDFLRKNMG
jgi:nicotinamide-nucleotide amidase